MIKRMKGKNCGNEKTSPKANAKATRTNQTKSNPKVPTNSHPNQSHNSSQCSKPKTENPK
eukprot:m.280118 g.280118  ORF g.280118 m.280118 type:complete len:60 (+) comp147321_c0_seq1:43-222(+)